jgi:RNA polymerase sigma-70 factor (ECF subfamily)
MARIDRTELIRWYQASGPALVLYARTWLGPSEAQDAVQDVFVRAYGRGVEAENVRAWLYAAVRHRALDLAKGARRRAQRELVVGALLRVPGPALAELADVERAVAGLDEAAREVVVLRVWGALTFEEIGGVTGVSGATAFRVYRDALDSLRTALEVACTNPTTRTMR